MRSLLRNFLFIGAAFALVLYVGGCTASEEAEQEEGMKTEAPAEKQPDAKATMKKDTAEVKVLPPAKSEPVKEAIPPAPTPVTLFGVQVGAFENAENAARIEQTLKARFTQTVRKYYDEATKLHKVSIGSFATRDQALEFRKMLHEKYPGEYKDAWIVEVQK
ncbi:MAG: SPOR domain-containing protein [Bacteroidota bacterium]